MEKQISTDTVLIPSENVVTRDIEGDIIIVPLVSGIGDADDELYTLNETGRAIWARLDGQVTLGAVAQQLAKEFSAPQGELEADVLGFGAEMVRHGILDVKN